MSNSDQWPSKFHQWPSTLDQWPSKLPDHRESFRRPSKNGRVSDTRYNLRPGSGEVIVFSRQLHNDIITLFSTNF